MTAARRLKSTGTLLAAIFAAFCLTPSHAFATCTSPAGNPGDISYSSITSTMYYCGGSTWVSMGGAPAVGFGTLTTNDFCAATSGTAISCTTGYTGTLSGSSVVLSISPTLTGTVAGANSTWSGQVAIGTSALSGALNINGTATATLFSGSGASLTGIGTASLTAITGSASSTTYLTGNGTWTTPAASLPSLASTDVWVGNGSNVATATATTGTGNVVMSASPTLSGTITGGTFSGTHTGNGSGLTSLNASNLSSGTVPTSVLGSCTASSTTFLAGNGTWATPSGGMNGSGSTGYDAIWASATAIGTGLISETGGKIGVGTAAPQSMIQAYNGEVQVGSSGASCSSSNAGALRYSSALMFYCNGSACSPLSGGCVGIGGTDTSLASGLVSYWRFAEDGGTTVGDAQGTNTGTWQGTLGSQWTTGIINFAGNFDGTDNYVSTANSISKPLTYTLSAWFKTSTASGHKIIGFESSQTGTTSSSYDAQLYVGTNGYLYFGNYSTASVLITSSGTVTNGAWHHAVGIENAGTMSLYLDGALQGTAAGSTQAYTGYWRIGSYLGTGWTNGSNGYFTGQIAEVGVWNVALTGAQVTTLYNSGAGNALGGLTCKSQTSTGGFAN